MTVALDTASAFPLTAKHNVADGNFNTISISGVTTSANAMVVVVIAANGTNNAFMFSSGLTISTNAGVTWTVDEQQNSTSGYQANQMGTWIWHGYSASGLSSQTITITYTGAAGSGQAVLGVYSFTGASSTIGNLDGAVDSAGTAIPVACTINMSAGSMGVCGSFTDANAAPSALANSTMDISTTESGSDFGAVGIFHLTSPTSGTGNVTFGKNQADQADSARAGVEILADTGGAAPNIGFRQVGGPRQIGKFDPANQFTPPKAYLVPDPPAAPTFWKLQGPAQQVGKSPAGRFRSPPTYSTIFDPSTTSWMAVLPESFTRPNWNPERTESDRAGWTQALWAIPPTWKPAPVLPEARLTPWNPERSHSVGITYLPPKWPTTVVAPERNVRPAWEPERTHSVGISYLPPTWPMTVVTPERNARPPWDPEKGWQARAGWIQALWAIAPQKIPEPVLPERLLVRWRPPDQQPVWPPFQFGAPPTWGYELLGPQSFARFIWNAQRSDLTRAGWTQGLWAIPPPAFGSATEAQFISLAMMESGEYSAPRVTPIPVFGYQVHGPERLLLKWNPERSGFSRAGFTQAQWAVPPTRIPEPVLPLWVNRPLWIPERTIIAHRIVVPPAPLLSWRPELLERFVQALRAPPNLDLFSPALPIGALLIFGPALFGRQETTALQGKQAADGLRGEDDSDPVKGRPG